MMTKTYTIPETWNVDIQTARFIGMENPMTANHENKLTEIRAVIAEYDRATKVYEELFPGIWDAKATADVTRARNRLIENAPDYLRLLLPVVEAAVASELGEPLVVTDGQTRMECSCCGNRIRTNTTESQHAEDCAWLLLQKALEALQ